MHIISNNTLTLNSAISALSTYNTGKGRYILYIDSNGTFGAREKGLSITDIWQQRSYNPQVIACHLNRVFSNLDFYSDEIDWADLEIIEQALSTLSPKLSTSFPQAGNKTGLLETVIQSVQAASQARLLTELVKAIETNDKEKLDKLIEKLHFQGYSKNDAFWSSLSIKIAQNYPDYLLENLDKFPFSDKNQVLLVSRFLPDSLRTHFIIRFAIRMGITGEEIAEARSKFSQYLKDLPDIVLSNGICLGFTRACISEALAPSEPKPSEATYKKGRFLHASYVAGKRNSEFKISETIGKQILKTPSDFPFVLSRAANILGFTDTQALVREYNLDDKFERTPPAVIAKIIGQIAMSHRNPDNKDQPEALTKSEIEKLGQISLGVDVDLRFKEMPPIIKKEFGLNNSQTVFSQAPMSTLSESLRQSKELEGKFHLGLSSFDGKTPGHAIYLSFNPPSFCDINDVDHTGTPILRTFDTADAMIDALCPYLDLAYLSDKYAYADLTQYMNPNVQAAPVLVEHHL